MLWTARKSLKNKEEKRLFDKMVLNGLEYSPQDDVTFVDIIQAFLQSDDEIAGKQFCKPLLDAADKYKLLNITESTTKARIDKMRKNCPASTGTPQTRAHSAKKITTPPFDVARTSTGKCKSPTDKPQNMIPITKVSQVTAEQNSSDAKNIKGSTLDSIRQNTNSNGCSGTLKLSSTAHGQALHASSSSPNKHNQLSWWWLWMCLPLWVMTARKKRLLNQ